MLLAYVVKKDLFKCVMEIFIENVDKPNLLHSCILEMFDSLTKEYNKTLGQYLVSFELWALAAL